MRSVFVFVAVLGMLSTVPGAEFDLSWHSIDAGGVMHSTGGDFELSGTIGQPDAGVLTNGSLTLTGGFWFATPIGDCNQDGVTGLSDMPSFEECLLGPAALVPSGSCRCFDVNSSGRVDLADFAEVQLAFCNE
jgi:hypothetical protein